MNSGLRNIAHGLSKEIDKDGTHLLLLLCALAGAKDIQLQSQGRVTVKGVVDGVSLISREGIKAHIEQRNWHPSNELIAKGVQQSLLAVAEKLSEMFFANIADTQMNKIITYLSSEVLATNVTSGLVDAELKMDFSLSLIEKILTEWINWKLDHSEPQPDLSEQEQVKSALGKILSRCSLRLSLCRILTDRGYGAKVCARVTKSDIPSLAYAGIDQTVFDDLLHVKAGMIVVSGPTGSGKSTGCAAILYEQMARRPINLYTIEDPVEFMLPGQVIVAGASSDPAKVSICTQRNIGAGGCVQDFQLGIQTALRQSADVIFVGEIRNKEVFLAGAEATETGHQVLTTMHADCVAGLFQRVSALAGTDIHAQQSLLLKFINNCNLVTCQFLAKTPDGGAVPVIEWLWLTPDVKAIILNAGDRLQETVQNLLTTKGTSFMHQLERMQRIGVLDEACLLREKLRVSKTVGGAVMKAI